MRKLWIKLDAYNQILSKTKNLEIRLNYGFNKTLKNNEILELCCNNKTTIINIQNIKCYDNLDDLLENEDLGISKKDAIELYTNIYGNKLSKYKLVCFNVYIQE